MVHFLDLSEQVFVSLLVVDLFKKFKYLPNEELVAGAVDSERSLGPKFGKTNKKTNKQTKKNASCLEIVVLYSPHYIYCFGKTIVNKLHHKKVDGRCSVGGLPTTCRPTNHQRSFSAVVDLM